MKNYFTKNLTILLLFISSAQWAKLPIILDTDMGFDDWVAILYVLNNKSVDMKAITIDCNGLTYCPSGGVNAAKLAQLIHHRVPIYIGRVDESEKKYTFPNGLRQYSSEMADPGFTQLMEHWLLLTHRNKMKCVVIKNLSFQV